MAPERVWIALAAVVVGVCVCVYDYFNDYV